MITATDAVEQQPITAEASGVGFTKNSSWMVHHCTGLQREAPQVQTFSPFLDYFDDVIREEWANPGGGTSLLPIAKHLYSLPEETMEDLKVPLIDAPMVAFHSGAVMPKDGENALKDAMDRKNEATLKKAHEAMSLAIRPAAALSNFTSHRYLG
ncbi:UNVERIFIED_CONTAM: hypothetical protein K2H54_039012 [Gekko kuhli]